MSKGEKKKTLSILHKKEYNFLEVTVKRIKFNFIESYTPTKECPRNT